MSARAKWSKSNGQKWGQWQGWIQVKWKPGTPANAWSTWQKHHGVKGVWSTQGDWDCSIWLDVDTPDELEAFVWKHVRSNRWVEDTETSWAKQLAWAA